MSADKDAPRSTPFGLYERSQRPRLTGIEWSALFFSALWLGISGYFVLTLPPASQTGEPGGLRFLITMLAIFLPVAMIWVAATAARASRVMREESHRLQAAIDAIRQAYVAQSQGRQLASEPSVARKLDEIAAAARKTETEAELAEIKAMHYEMLAAFTRRDLPGYYRLNSAIHEAINAAAKNPVLSATYRQVNARLQALRFRSNQDGEKWSAAVKEHEAMVQALDQRDPAAMRAVLLSHLNHKRDVVMAQLHSRSQAGAQA